MSRERDSAMLAKEKRQGLPQPASSALDGLHEISAEDLPRYKAAVAAGEQHGWGYYFPYLCARNLRRQTRVLIGEDDGSICVYLRRVRRGKAKLDVLLSPAPLNIPVFKRCLERANEHNGDFSARVMKVDERDAAALAGIRHVKVRPRKSQYLYDPSTFRKLSGNRYRTFRRNVALVEALPDVEVSPLALEHLDDCRDLLRAWQHRHRDRHGSSGAAGTSTLSLELFGKLPHEDFNGEAVFVDGKLAAFSLGGEIRSGLGCYFEAKNDFDIAGLSYYLRRSYLKGMTRFKLVNDGSDTGRAGLKQLKDSLRPIAMHVEYRGHQRAG